MNTVSKQRRILVTAALPYANGDIHLGHLVEYLQTDFWVRFQKMRGHECIYICADDTHGTPVMISAKKAGVTPEQLVERNHAAHVRDFSDFEIEFDNYYSTNSPENRVLSGEFFQKMKTAGHIETRPIVQFYCEKDAMFLPDRFVIGTCPRCGAAGQYGDSCDKCSASYSSAELKEARCSICGQSPVEKSSEHFFFKLNHFREFLLEWVKGHTSADVMKKLDEWLKDDLRDWDISRDAPYFGFEIPGHPGKYFYVWLDAPLGYIASTKNWADRHGRDFGDFWLEGRDTELYHFIGKDIVYFHTLFWPAMLHTAGYKTPDQVFVHGHLIVNGEKMSKSKGTYIKARTYLDHLPPLYLRYYYAAKMTSGMDDIDLSLDDFVNRVNSELIGKITNLASRAVQMLNKIDSRLGSITPSGRSLIESIRSQGEAIARHYENRDFSRALAEIRAASEQANRYFDEKEPWKLIQTDTEATRSVLTDAVNLFRILAIYLKPVLPNYTAKVERLLCEAPYNWESSTQSLENREIGCFEHLAVRLERKKIEEVIEHSMEKPIETIEQSAPARDLEPLQPMIEFADFAKVDLRVAKVLEAEAVPDADKLIRLKIDIGMETRTIFAGIKKAYDPAALVGRQIIVVANLKPRQMKFGLSEGMLLAAGPGGSEVFLLGIDPGTLPGDRIH